MKKNFKRIVSVILCLVILCCPFANVMQPAHAANPIAWVASMSVYEFMAFVFGLVGIAFLSQGDMVQASNQYLASNPTISTELEDKLATAKSEINGTHTLQMGAILFLYMKNTVIPSVIEFFSRADTAVVVPDTSAILFQNVPMLDVSSMLSVKFIQLPYSSSQTVDLMKNNQKLSFSMYDDGNRMIVKCNGQNVMSSERPHPDPMSYILEYRWGFITYIATDDGKRYIRPVCSGYAVHKITGVRTDYDAPATLSALAFDDALGWYMSPTGGLSYGSQSLPYGYDIDYSKSEFMNALEKIYQAILGLGTAISIPWDGPMEDVEEGQKEVEENTKPIPYVPEWARWWELLGIKELIETVTQSKTVTESDVKMPELPVSIKDKFPFCVPFDVYYMIEKLNATSVAPSWNIPFKIQSLGINQNIPLDLSGWESVAAVCRWANVLLFILALVLLTRNIIRA